MGKELRVKKRSGQLVKFRSEKIAAAIQKASESAEQKVDVEALTKRVTNRVVRKKATIIRIDHIQDLVEDELVKADLTEVARASMLYRQKRREERDAKTALFGKVQKTNLSLNAAKLLHDRYLLRDDEGNVIESPDELFDRVASATAEAEYAYAKNMKKDEREALVRRMRNKFRRALSGLDFLPSSSVIMNAGLPDTQYAASTAFPVKDHLNDIFGTLRQAVDVQRHGSGTGFNFSSLRERFANVHQHRQISGGPLQFLHVYNEALSIILQNGRRPGANMAILDVRHPDVLDFISAKVKDYQLTNFNISVSLDDEFIRAIILDKEYDLLTPTTSDPVRTMYAKQVFDIIVASAWNYADPGILFIDKIEADNPIPSRKICSTSACAEFILNEYECGFIGSINLANFVTKDEGKNTKPEIDYKRLRETIFLGVRFLDNLIDINTFPLKQSEKICKEQRKIGLGVMGLAHMLYQLRIPYDSESGVRTAGELARFLRSVADEASFELAQERGVFPAWKKSIYAPKKDLPKGLPMRNATRLAVSPTGSTSILADTSSSIEPVFALSYVKHVAGGKELSYVDPYLQEALEEEGILTQELLERIVNNGLSSCEEVPKEILDVFVTTHNISPEYHVRMQATWQKFVDNGVSKTVNLPYDATLLDVENVFMLAYKLGCKGVTIYRDGSKQNQVLELTTFMQKRTGERHTTSVREELRAQLSNKSLDEFSKKEE
ncbi:adenosylcobalamin-dependent ribonucleoside-diphosphate reductase [Candidatus Woesearchaeota archaeon]|nr:adenosylcobalamin-dependent ribonucleoside-diphosphate reductase [Candidatus Woesearchaeota archaeon]